MLNSFRSMAHSWVAKILMLLLILSFGLWGIGDMLRSGGSAMEVAKVGGTAITGIELQRALRVETENVRRMLGDHDSPEIHKTLNLPQRALQKLINRKLI